MHFRMTAAAPDWNHYRSLLAVIETGSLSGAARRLGLAQPTVGRHIEALEEALGGGALFTRSQGGLAPTQTALALRPHAEAMAVAAETLIRTASGEADAVRGAVRVTASEIVGAEVLPPMLTTFHEAWPEVEIELVLSNRQEDLLRRDADIAVRMARPSQNALFARRIGSVRVNFYAHRDYVARHGAPADFDALAAHPLIGFDHVAPPPEAVARLGRPIARELFALRSDSDLAQLAAMRAAFGVGACQAPLAARDPDLIPILEGLFGFDMEAWVVMHEDLKSNRRMRLLFDHLVAGMKAYVGG
jgi:DNA-binding transcriptional LysR family regulator